MLNLVKNYFSKYIYDCQLWWRDIKYIIEKKIYNVIEIYYSKIRKFIIVNNSIVGLPSHPYHIVDQSPWPIVLSCVLLSLTISAVLSFHGYVMGDFLLLSSFILLIWGMSLWFKDIITEASYLGAHTDKVQKGISLGVVLFSFRHVVLSAIFAFAVMSTQQAEGKEGARERSEERRVGKECSS